MQTNFLLGTLKLTETARMALKRQPFDLIARHAVNEHGLITKKEQESNEKNMKTLGPIISRYKLDPTDPKSPNVIVYTRDKWDETLVTLE
jgi:predicted transcriptional regulator